MYYEHVLSIGHRCTSQIAIQYLSKSIKQYGETSPFSWVNNFNSKNILLTIKSKFNDYLENEISGEYHKKDSLPTCNKHGFGHYNMKDKSTIHSFNRKIQRFMNILEGTNGTVLFVYMNEDYLYNEEYRQMENKNYLVLIELCDYLRNTYPKLKFHILNVVFQERENTSHIINIKYNNIYPYITRKDWIKNMKLRSVIETQFRDFCSNSLLNFIYKKNSQI
tara:strand:- start:320 stop:982 length:663 start_codon:yes stop_codon:yes gene_type:complete